MSLKRMIYADNAATTQLDSEAFDAMKPYLLDLYGNASQPYAFARYAKEALKQARVTISSCINADPDEIYFTSGGTESNNWAIKGITQNHCKGSIITSKIEHHAVLNTCLAIEEFGFLVTFLPVDKNGIVQQTTLQEFKSDNTKLVSIMLANNEIGSIQPIKDLCAIAHEMGALFHTDAVQAVGHIPVDVKALNVDMLSASAHKFNGPKGIGFLYIRNGTKVFPYQHGGAQEHKMRAGTENIASIIGMAISLKKNCDLLTSNMSYISSLEDGLLSLLRSSKVTFERNGAIDHIPGNISLSFCKKDGEAILHRMDLQGICISTGAACDSRNTQVSHVLQAIGLPEELSKGTIRISLGKSNTLEDIETIANSLTHIIQR